MRQLSEAIDGIALACNALGTPITGGNVSLYNETRGEGIYTTPVVGVVGILEDVSKAVPTSFQHKGDAILLLTLPSGPAGERLIRQFGSSEYAGSVFGKLWGTPPGIDLADEAALHECLAALVKGKLVHSACTVFEGGLASALAEACFENGLGAQVILGEYSNLPDYPDACRLFIEEASQAVLTCREEDIEAIKGIADDFGFVLVLKIGNVQSKSFEIAIGNRQVVSAHIDELRRPWTKSLEDILAASPVVAEVMA